MSHRVDAGNGTWASAGTVSSNLQGSSCFCRPGEFFLSTSCCSDWVISIILSSRSLVLLSPFCCRTYPLGYFDHTYFRRVCFVCICACMCVCMPVCMWCMHMRLTSGVSLSYSLPYILWQGLSLEPTAH